MELKNKIEIALKDIDKCFLILDSDCPLGQIYDFSCALQSFVLKKMSEFEQKPESKNKECCKE